MMKKVVLALLMLVLLQEVAMAQPIVPGGLTASALSTSGIVLNWTDNSTNETGFQIERSLTASSGFSLITTTAANTTSYISSGLVNSTKYFYRIRATNAGGNSAYTSVVTATTGIRRFLIDFGNPTNQTSLAGWNNVTSPATGTIVSLKESTGTSTSLSLQIIKNPSNNY